jgi:AcrR family transcriptional regulator
MIAKKQTASKTPVKTSTRKRAALATRETILRAAIKVFSKYGLSGGSIDKISHAARSHDRMIYYYFGNKDGLFVAALEEIYRRFNEAQAKLVLDVENAEASMRQIIQFILHYYRDHPEFITILNSENLLRGQHISKSRTASEYSTAAIGVIEQTLVRGCAQGLFRSEIRPRDIYLMIASLGYFYQSNRFTLTAFLGENLESPKVFAEWEDFVTNTVMRTIKIAD